MGRNVCIKVPVIVIRLLFLTINNICILRIVHPEHNKTISFSDTVNVKTKLFALNHLELMMLKGIRSQFKKPLNELQASASSFLPYAFNSSCWRNTMEDLCFISILQGINVGMRSYIFSHPLFIRYKILLWGKISFWAMKYCASPLEQTLDLRRAITFQTTKNKSTIRIHQNGIQPLKQAHTLVEINFFSWLMLDVQVYRANAACTNKNPCHHWKRTDKSLQHKTHKYSRNSRGISCFPFWEQ